MVGKLLIPRVIGLEWQFSDLSGVVQCPAGDWRHLSGYNVADLSPYIQPIHFPKLSATDGTYGSKLVKPGFGSLIQGQVYHPGVLSTSQSCNTRHPAGCHCRLKL